MTDVATEYTGIDSNVPGHEQWFAPHNPWLTAVVTTLATFMEVLDTTIVNVSLPHMAGTLGSTPTDTTWVLTSYLVSNAIILPISAWFSSVFGRRNYYMMCVALFTVSSFLCGLAPTLGALVFFRLLQGVGGGGLQPTSQAIMVDTFPPRQRGMSMAIFGMTVVVAPIIGPTLGGWITDNMSWRWIFFLNVPVGLLSLALVPRLVHDPPYLVRRRGKDRFRVDLIGLGLLAVGLGSLQIVLDLGERLDWFGSRLITALVVCSVFALIAVVIWELRSKDPIVNFRLLRESNLGFSTLTMFLFGFGLYGSTVLLPLYMQTLMGYTSMLSGMAITPGGILVMVMLPFIGMMVSRFDARAMIAFGIAVIAVSMYTMGWFDLNADFWTIARARMLQGFGMAFVFVPVNTIAYAYVKREDRNSASSLINLARNIGGSVGIAFSSTMVTRGTQTHLTALVSHATPYDPAYTDTIARLKTVFLNQTGDPVGAATRAYALTYGFIEQQARMLAYVDVFRYLALALLFVVPVAFFMKRPKTS